MTDTEYNGIIVHFSKILDVTQNKTSTAGVLFSHPLFFMQNDEIDTNDSSNDTTTSVDSDDERDNVSMYKFNVKAAKALLLLHSLPFNYDLSKIKSFFNNAKAESGGFEIMPYGFLALCGGLLYRQRHYVDTEKDIINIGDDYKKPGFNDTLLVKMSNKISFGVISKSENPNIDYVKVDTIINPNIDLYIKNKLISLFVDFVTSTSDIFDSLELKYAVGEGDVQVEKIFTSTTFKQLTDAIAKEGNVVGINRILIGKNTLKIDDCSTAKVVGFNKHYSIGFMKNGRLFIHYQENDIFLQSLFDKLYCHMCGVVTNVSQNDYNSRNLQCNIPETVYKNVVSGFTGTLKTLMEKYNKAQSKKKKTNTNLSKNKSEDDLKKNIYIYIKQFWDKWLCNVYNENPDAKVKDLDFSVKWMNNYFSFIDSYYRDIDDKLKLGCDVIDEIYQGSLGTDNTSETQVLNHLANIAERHHCNFFCYPDFINFKTDSQGNSVNPKEVLRDLFKPIPYSRMNKMNNQNRFMVIRVTDAQINGDKIQYANDGFDIYTSSNDTAIAEYSNSKVKDLVTNQDDELYLGRQIPAFGVSYSRSNNHLFTSIDVGMDNNQITEQSIKSLCYISQNGNKNKRSISFYGSDIYGVYSAYSYYVTITMLGNAQIQPLMYFQLMNVPLFRGAYIIIEVKHSIQAGKFTTTFRGMKLSKIEPPYTSAWFTIQPDASSTDELDDEKCGNEDEVDENGDPIGDDSSETSEDTNDTFITLFAYGFDVSQLHVAMVGDDSSKELLKDDNTLKSPKELGVDYKLLTVGTNFLTKDEKLDGVLIIDGTKVGDSTESENGGFILYKNNTFKFCENGSEFQTNVSDVTNIKYAWQNKLCVYNGVANKTCITNNNKYNFKCLGEDDNGKLYVYVPDGNKCTFGEFISAIENKKLKNAIYIVSGSGHDFGWVRSNSKSNYQKSSGVASWGSTPKKVKTVLYIK